MTPVELVAVVLAAALGGAVQATLGFGGSFVMVPVVTLVAPAAVPGAVLLGLLPLTTMVAWRERAALDRPTFVTVAWARLPGILLGSWVVAVVSTRTLTLVVAVALLVAVAATVGGWQLPRTATTLRAVGFVSGVTGTAVALGGPPLALVFHDRGGADRRATMSAVFSLGIVLALGSLAVAGEFGTGDVAVGALLGVALVAGGAATGTLARRLGDDVLRRAVLGWAAVGAVVAGARGLA